MKTTIKLTLASIAIFANLASAASIRFDGAVFGGPPSPDQNWTTAVNWNGDVVPGINDDALINVTGSGIALINSNVGSIANLNVGVDESGTLDVTTGGVLTTTPGGFSSLGIGGGTNTGTLNLSGGTLTFNEALFVGVDNNSTGILNISSGSMRVNGLFAHNINNSAATAQTVLSGGLLDVNSMTLNSGVFNVAGGTLRLRNGDQRSQVANWAGSGRMIANGGNSSPSAVYDAGNNWTTVTVAVPSTTPATFRFSGLGSSNKWTNPQNWVIQDTGATGVLPGVIDVVRFNFGGAAGVLDSDVGSVDGLQIGVDESGTLTVATGGVLTTTPGNFSGIGIGGGTNTGTLNLNGGTLTFNNIFLVAQGGASTGLLNITSGSMRVADQFIHNVDSQPNAIAQTVLSGGLLDVNSMTLNSGTFNVAGGTLRLRNGDQTSQVATWSSQGRMIANGGTSSLSAVYDAGNNWTTVTAPTDYEIWGATYGFGAGSRDGDIDNDGVTNFEEYAFGLFPNSGASVNPIKSPLNKATGKFSYTRRTATGLTYSVWFSTNLAVWTRDTGAAAGTPVPNGANETVEVTLSTLPGVPLPAKLFIQVRAN